MPCGAIPVTRVRNDEEYFKDNINDKFTKAFQENMPGTAGLPIGVLVGGLAWKDELCFSIMHKLEKKIQFSHDI